MMNICLCCETVMFGWRRVLFKKEGSWHGIISSQLKRSVSSRVGTRLYSHLKHKGGGYCKSRLRVTNNTVSKRRADLVFLASFTFVVNKFVVFHWYSYKKLIAQMKMWEKIVLNSLKSQGIMERHCKNESHFLQSRYLKWKQNIIWVLIVLAVVKWSYEMFPPTAHKTLLHVPDRLFCFSLNKVARKQCCVP